MPREERGFYFLSDRKLFSVAGPAQAPRRLLPNVENIIELAAGPADWLILRQGDNPRDDFAKIYCPNEEALIYLNGEELAIEDRINLVTYAPATKLFLLITRNGTMLALSPARIEALPRHDPKIG